MMRRYAQSKMERAKPWGSAPNPALAVRQWVQEKHLHPLPRVWLTSKASRVRLRPSAHPFGARPANTNFAGLRSAAASALALDPFPVRCCRSGFVTVKTDSACSIFVTGSPQRDHLF